MAYYNSKASKRLEIMGIREANAYSPVFGSLMGLIELNNLWIMRSSCVENIVLIPNFCYSRILYA